MFQEIKPTIWIGKRGYSEMLIDEIKAQLKVRRYVKIRWLRTAEIDPEEIARRAGAALVGVRGRTMVLAEQSGGSRKA
ncbi:MAG: RNA-binding protein [Methanofollis sp.]|nr:RNA-binding protein [Methanofollis sp.]